MEGRWSAGLPGPYSYGVGATDAPHAIGTLSIAHLRYGRLTEIAVLSLPLVPTRASAPVPGTGPPIAWRGGGDHAPRGVVRHKTTRDNSPSDGDVPHCGNTLCRVELPCQTPFNRCATGFRGA